MMTSSDPSWDAAPSRAASGWGQVGAVAAVALALMVGQGRAASPGPASGPGTPHGAPVPTRSPEAPAAAPRAPAAGQDGDAGSRSVAARARMNECGHQWNNMKRAGTASGTWKEFSRNCLAQK